MVVDGPLVSQVLGRGLEVDAGPLGLDPNQLGEPVKPDRGQGGPLLAHPVPVSAGEVVAQLH